MTPSCAASSWAMTSVLMTFRASRCKRCWKQERDKDKQSDKYR